MANEPIPTSPFRIDLQALIDQFAKELQNYANPEPDITNVLLAEFRAKVDGMCDAYGILPPGPAGPPCEGGLYG